MPVAVRTIRPMGEAALPAVCCEARRPRGRRGMVLYAVMVILTMVALVAVSLLFSMQAEVAACAAAAGQQQAYQAALSGIQRAMVVVAANRDNTQTWWDDEDLFRDQLVWDNGTTQWYFTVYAHNPEQPELPRYGVSDEAALININTASRDTLLALPNMTDVLADNLLQYRGTTDRMVGYGGDQSYGSLSAYGYLIRNADLETLEELLLVRGFDATIVFGEDANLNGLLDPNENDGGATFPPDDGDGVLDRGLAGVATAFTIETHRDSRGRPRIDLNGAVPALAQSGLRPQILSYIAAYRHDGNQFGHPSELLEAVYEGSGGSVESGVTAQDMEDLLDRFTAAPAVGFGVDPFTLEELFASSQDDYSDEYDDFDAIAADPAADDPYVNGSGQPLPQEMQEFEEEIQDDLDDETPRDWTGRSERRGAAGRESRLRGRDRMPGAAGRGAPAGGPAGGVRGGTSGLLNVNTASVEVLAAVGDMGPDLAREIVEYRDELTPERRRTPAWLLTEGLVDVETFKRIAPMLTARSDQYRVRCVGYGLPGGQFSVLDAVIDLSSGAPRIVYLRQLTRLGAPFALTGPAGRI